jgi:hypothetical protein
MATIPNVFDKYERVARVYPALIVGPPALVAGATTIPTPPTQTWTASTITAAVLLAMLYALTTIVRMCGRSIEPSLWNSWGGPPSTRMMLWSDPMMSDAWKEKAHALVKTAINIDLHSKRKESHNQDEAKKLVADAFSQVKTILDIEKPEGKYQVHNIEYGFCRNLLGASWPLGVGISIASAAWCVAFSLVEHQVALPLIGIISSLLWGVLLLLGRRLWLPVSVKLCADRYAEKAWTTFLELRAKKD